MQELINIETLKNNLNSDNLQLISDAIECLLDCANKIHFDLVDYEVSQQSTLLTKYISATPSPNQLISIYAWLQQLPPSNPTALISNKIIILLSRLINFTTLFDHKYHSFSSVLIKGLVKLDFLKWVFRNLSNQSDLHSIQATLYLLVAIASYNSGQYIRELHDNFNFGMKSLQHLFKYRKKQQESDSTTESRPIKKGLPNDIRTNYIKFIITFLQYGDPSIKKSVLEIRDFVSGVLKGLAYDTYEVVQLYLDSLRIYVVDDDHVSRSCKVSFFNNWVLDMITKLYSRTDLLTCAPLTLNSELDNKTIANLAHEFLLHLTTNPGIGICFQDAGWYLPERNANSSATANSNSNVRVYNTILLRFLNNLNISDDDVVLQKELVVEILKSAPELMQPYLNSVKISPEPRLSPKYLSNMSFLIKLIQIPPPSLLTLSNKSTWSQVPLLPSSSPPLLETVLDNTFPSILSKAISSKSLQFNVDGTVKYIVVTLLNSCFTKLEMVLQEIDACMKIACESQTITEEWCDFRKLLLSAFWSRLPDLQILLSVFSWSLSLVNDKQVSITPMEIDNVQKPVELSSEQLEKEKQDSPHLLVSTILLLLTKYQLHFPLIMISSRYDYGKLLAVINFDDPEYDQINGELLNLFLGYTGELKWWNASDGKSHLATIIKLHLTTKNPQIKETSMDIVQKWLSSSILFQDYLQIEIPLWVSVLKECHSSRLLLWLDELICKSLREPYKLIDILNTFIDDETDVNSRCTLVDKIKGEARLPFSFLIVAFFEQRKKNEGIIDAEIIQYINSVMALVLYETQTAAFSLNTLLKYYGVDQVVDGPFIGLFNETCRLLGNGLSSRVDLPETYPIHPELSKFFISNHTHMNKELKDLIQQSAAINDNIFGIINHLILELNLLFNSKSSVERISTGFCTLVYCLNRVVSNDNQRTLLERFVFENPCFLRCCDYSNVSKGNEGFELSEAFVKELFAPVVREKLPVGKYPSYLTPYLQNAKEYIQTSIQYPLLHLKLGLFIERVFMSIRTFLTAQDINELIMIVEEHLSEPNPTLIAFFKLLCCSKCDGAIFISSNTFKMLIEQFGSKQLEDMDKIVIDLLLNNSLHTTCGSSVNVIFKSTGRRANILPFVTSAFVKKLFSSQRGAEVLSELVHTSLIHRNYISDCIINAEVACDTNTCLLLLDGYVTVNMSEKDNEVCDVMFKLISPTLIDNIMNTLTTDKHIEYKPKLITHFKKQLKSAIDLSEICDSFITNNGKPKEPSQLIAKVYRLVCIFKAMYLQTGSDEDSTKQLSSLFLVVLFSTRYYFSFVKKLGADVEVNSLDFYFNENEVLITKMMSELKEMIASLSLLKKKHLKFLFEKNDYYKNLIRGFIVSALKNRLVDSRVLGSLFDLIRFEYFALKSKGTVSFTPEKLVEMIMSHSQFDMIIKSSSNEKSVFDIYSHSFTGVIQFLTNVMDLDPPNSYKSENLLQLSSAYTGTLSKADQCLFGIFSKFESELGISVTKFMLNRNQNDALGFLETFSKLDSALMAATMNEFDPCLDFASVPVAKDEKTYDPRFLIPLVVSVFERDIENKLDLKKMFESNVVGVCIMAVSSEHLSMRKAGYFALAKVYQAVTLSEFKEKNQILLLLDTFKNAITDIERLPAMISLFLAQSLVILLKPESHMYPQINRFFLQRPILHLEDVPLFYNMYFSTTQDSKKERLWMLRLLSNGISSVLDYKLCQRRHVFDVLFGFFLSPLSDVLCRKLISEILYRATALPSLVADLVTNNGLLAFLQNATGLIILEQDNDLAIPFVRVLSKVFNGWKDANENWHGRSGSEVWAESFLMICITLVEKLQNTNTSNVCNTAWKLNLVMQVTKFIELVLCSVNSRPALGFKLHHAKALCAIAEFQCKSEIQVKYDRRVDEHELFQFVDDEKVLRDSIGVSIFNICLVTKAESKSGISAVVKWTSSFMRTSQLSEIKIGWLKWLLTIQIEQGHSFIENSLSKEDYNELIYLLSIMHGDGYFAKLKCLNLSLFTYGAINSNKRSISGELKDSRKVIAMLKTLIPSLPNPTESAEIEKKEIGVFHFVNALLIEFLSGKIDLEEELWKNQLPALL